MARTVPIKTSVEDIERLLGYMNKQIGWVEQSKIEKALGASAIDDRKIAAMADLGFLERDGSNIKLTRRGQVFATGSRVEALRAAINDIDLYRATIEWIHYGSKGEITAAEIGQYWETSHKDTVGDLKGTTLKDGAICFGRIADGAGFGNFKVGRAGRETRLNSDLDSIASFLDEGVSPASVPEDAKLNANDSDSAESQQPNQIAIPNRQSAIGEASPSTTVTASPNIHVNVQIHIAADATADTVREIFKNMAYYVLDKNMPEDGDA